MKPMETAADMPDHAHQRGYSDHCLGQFRIAANALLRVAPDDVQEAMNAGHKAAVECMGNGAMSLLIRRGRRG